MDGIPPALAPIAPIFGLIYQAGVSLRNHAYSSGLLRTRRLERPVISIGNMTTGGTGKTPFVIHLAEILRNAGCDIAVLTRGYGRIDADKAIILPPGDGTIANAALIGDEPALLRRRLPYAWMGVSANRFEAGTTILREAPRTVFLLDDGFQHRGLFRNLDIVMIDASRPLADERIIPCGALREPLRGLRRARMVIINETSPRNNADAAEDDANTSKIMERNLRKLATEAVFFRCVQRIKCLIPFDQWLHAQEQDGAMPTTASSKPVFLAAAIGNPERFQRDVQQMGIAVVGRRFFRDHDVISSSAWDALIAEAQQENAAAIVVTEKDAVKISAPPDFPLLVAVQTTELKEAARFREILRSCI